MLTSDNAVSLDIGGFVSILQKHVCFITTFHLSEHEYNQLAITYNRSTASHSPARSKTFCKLLSTLSPSVPISDTLTLSNGFPASAATLSAVSVFPTPGTPVESQMSACFRIDRPSWENSPHSNITKPFPLPGV